MSGSIAALVVTGFLTSGCSSDSAKHSHFTRTGAVAPDACTLINDSLTGKLVGDYTRTRTTRTPDASACSWQAPPSTELSKLSGLLDVSAVTATMEPTWDEKYSGAKSTYRELQNKEVCYKLTTSADEACWQKWPETVIAIARRGYTVVKADYTASNSPALKDQNMEKTAQSLVNEMLLHLHS